MSKDRQGANGDDFDEEELIRSEFDSIVSGLSLDETSPTTYLDELDRIENSDGFVAPNPAPQSPRSFFFSAKRAIARWFKRGYHDSDGVEL
ncbi:unannotated protein [freshwater metagenome]|uniref:Unannotated protein n=1 Tax=freshwater metagenome TaxID=449393 RepID=A0A6J7HUH9_9ZZZZ|nr:hypothetical protein [Actinomycetota bacterium]